MAWSAIRVDLNERSRDFQPIALQPGFPVLDRFSANAGNIRHWLGRFAADAVWDDQTVRYFWRDDDVAATPTDIQPATKADMQQLLRSEVEALREKLKKAVVKSPNDRALLSVLKKRLDRVFSDEALVPGMFFKVRVQGRWRLLWCWGYDRRHSKTGRMSVCSNESCQLAFFDAPDLRHRCPRCGTRIQGSRLARTLAMIACVLLVCIGGFISWDHAGRPGFPVARVKLEIVDAVTEKPIRGVSLKETSASETRGLFTTDPVIDWEFKHGAAPLQISAQGYRPSQWKPPAGRLPSDVQRIALHGESELTGLVVENGTDNPIPFASIQLTKSGRHGTADDVGLFLLPEVPSGESELEVTAPGYMAKRVSSDVKPGRSPDILIALTGAAVVDGTIADAFNKQPIPNATIKLTGRPVEAKSDEKGAFHCGQLPGTTCRFEVAAPGYFTREFERPLDENEPTTLRFLLRPDLTTLDGLVVDSSGSPVAAAKVRLMDQDIKGTTSPDGSFHLEGVRRGLQRLEAAAEGYLKQVTNLDAPSADGKVPRIVLDGPVKLSGRIIDAARKVPVKGAEIRLADGRWKAESDGDGTFTLASLPVGTVTLQVIGRGYQTSQNQIDLEPGQSLLDIELHGATILSGTIVSAFDHRPIEGAEVRLEGNDVPTRSNDEGRFRFEGVVPGEFVLQVTADGFQTESVTHQIKADEETPVSIELRGAAKLEGRVVAASSGKPIPQAQLTVIGSDRKLVTDDQGEFAQDEYPGRPVRLSVSAAGYATEMVECDLSQPGAIPLLIRLKSPYSVKGQVVDAGSQKPVPGAKVSISGRGDSAVSDAQGQFEIVTPQAASYEFNVAAAGYPPQSFVERAQTSGTKPGEKNSDSVFFKLALQRDSEQTAATATAVAAPAGTELGSRTVARDPLDVNFFGVHTKAANVGYVVDCSGSMSGARLQRTKLELLNSVLNLHPKQMFYVAFFDDAPVLMFKDQKQPVIASALNKVRAYKWLKSVYGGGGTNPPPALKVVAEMNPQSIFLLSDGRFEPLEETLYDMLAERKIHVNTLAFEDESGKDELERIATRTGGTYRFIPKAEIPEFQELSLLTRLYDELLHQWLDPTTPDAEAQDAHQALIEFCNGQDFGPSLPAGDAERRIARSNWLRWWVDNKLVPELVKQDEAKLQKNVRNPDPLWRWATIEALSQTGSKDASLFISKLQDTEGGIRQASRRALVKQAEGEDFGPMDNAGTDAQREAYEKWTGWWHRVRYMDALAKRTDESLVQEFDSPDIKMRRAAVKVAADRSRFQVPQRLIPLLADSDFEVRQSAHDALVKAAGKDLGPIDCSDQSVCTAAMKEWQNWYSEKVAVEADKILRLAESFESLQRKDAAREWYQKIVDKFPGTDAAKKAAEKLKSL